MLKSAIIFELYGMADSAYDVLQCFASAFPPSVNLQAGADALITGTEMPLPT